MWHDGNLHKYVGQKAIASKVSEAEGIAFCYVSIFAFLGNSVNMRIRIFRV
ncbi:MAG: hypothetical protein KAF91_09285 [Nostoc sp. TH1S01]|nr:hypothetical protein [Nostoc sp. TH1S01]